MSLPLFCIKIALMIGQEETLKRKSSDKETSVRSPKRRSVEAPRDKENYDSNDVDAPTPVRGLAALRKKTTEGKLMIAS